MNEKLERLKELAERATQGEWVAFCRSAASEEADIVVSDDAHDRIARTCPSSTDGVEYNNGQYIAAANPETIKGIIAELEAQEAEVEALKRELAGAG